MTTSSSSRDTRSTFAAAVRSTSFQVAVLIASLVATVFVAYRQFNPNEPVQYALAEITTVAAGVLAGLLMVLILRPGYFTKRTYKAGLADISKKPELRETQKKARENWRKAGDSLKRATDKKMGAEKDREAAEVSYTHANAKYYKLGPEVDKAAWEKARADLSAAEEQVKTREASVNEAALQADEAKEAAAEADSNFDKVPDQKILQPEYAIGQGLISRDEYNALQNEYLAQSDLTIGLIAPLALLLFAIVKTQRLGDWPREPVILAGLGVTTAVLFLLTMDRRHKYRVELRSLILGNWDKKREAAKAAIAAARAAAEAKAAADAKAAAEAKGKEGSPNS